MKRANHFACAPEAFELLMQQEALLAQSFTESEVLELKHLELIKMRISQINQCAFCIDMHGHQALAQGESAERLLALSAWREMPHFDNVERAVLAWAEMLNSGQPIDDQDYSSAQQLLGERALVQITLATNAISAWNRVAKTFKPAVGSYR